MPDNAPAGTAATAAAPQATASSTTATTPTTAPSLRDSPAGDADSSLELDRSPESAADKSEAALRAAYDKAKAGERITTPTTPTGNASSTSRESEATAEAASNPSDGPARGPDGKFLPRTVPAPGTPSKPPAGGGDKGKPAEKLPAILEQRQREDFVHARRALARDGFTAQELDGLSPERVISLGQKRAREQSAIDIAIRRRQITGSDLAAPGGHGAGPRAGTPSENGVHSSRRAAPQAGQARDRVDDLLAELEREDDPQGNASGDRRTAEDDPRQPTAETDSPVFRELVATRVEVAEKDVASDFPQLRDPRIAQEVYGQMGRLDPAGHAARESTEAVTQLMRDACYIVFGSQLAQQARTQARERNHAARLGQPDVASGPGEAPARKPTEDEFLRATYEAAKVSRTPQETAQKRDQILGVR